MKDYHSQYRDWILDYFQKHSNESLTAAFILEKMREAGMAVNQATVYRNLDRLEQTGKIKGHRLSNHDEKYYQYLNPVHDCRHHLHLYCRKCGKIIHLDGTFMHEIQDHLQQDYGFQLDCGDSVLTGLCEECRKEKEDGTVS